MLISLAHASRIAHMHPDNAVGVFLVIAFVCFAAAAALDKRGR